MEIQQVDKNRKRWPAVGAGLLLAALLVVPIVLVATMANPPPKAGFSIETIADPDGLLPQPTYPSGNIGSFAHGYLEFDVDPTGLDGVPGFDSWPPGRAFRR